MAEYTYADIIINPEDPRVEIGEKYYFALRADACIDYANRGVRVNSLDAIDTSGGYYPFITSEKDYPFIIRKKESVKVYVPFDLSDQVQIGMLYFCWIINKDSGDYHSVTAIYPNDNLIHIDDYGDVNPQELLEKFKFMHEDIPCGRLVEE